MRFQGFIIVVAASLAACGARAEDRAPEGTTFEIGPTDDPDRIRITIPVAYLNREPDRRDLVSSAPALIVDIATFAPALSNARGDPKTAYLRVDWIKEGTIAGWASNSSLSSYSVYNVPAASLHGLTRRLTQHGVFGDRSFILVDPEGSTLIECVQMVERVPMRCRMSAQYEKGLLIELDFDPAHLAAWRQLRDRAEAFVRPKTSFGEQTPLNF